MEVRKLGRPKKSKATAKIILGTRLETWFVDELRSTGDVSGYLMSLHLSKVGKSREECIIEFNKKENA